MKQEDADHPTDHWAMDEESAGELADDVASLHIQQAEADAAAAKNDRFARTLAREYDRISPKADFLAQNHLVFVANKELQHLRWEGELSFCRLVGERLGGPAADVIWQAVAEDVELQLIIGKDVLDCVPIGTENSGRAQVGRWTTSERRLLNPRQRLGWALLRTTVQGLYVLAAAWAAAETKEEAQHYLRQCWAWYRPSHPPSRPALPFDSLLASEPAPRHPDPQGCSCNG